jgi:putative ABC transport system substrate-binding protein
MPVDLLVTAGGAPAALAAKRATSTIPLLFVLVGDPVGTGLVDSFARPGGNLTGLSTAAVEISAKPLELLKETVPGLSRVAVLWNPANPATALNWTETEDAARTLGLRILSVEVRSSAEIEGALAGLGAERPDALVLIPDPLLFSALSRIVGLVAASRLPSMYNVKDYVDAGGLMAYGPSYSALFRRSASYVDKILKGMKPADLPVERPTEFEFVVNLQAAHALGLSIPRSVLDQATEIVQ